MAEKTGIDIESIELIHDWVIIDENISLQDQKLNEKSFIKMVLKNLKNKKKTCEDEKFDIYSKINELKDLIRKKEKNLKDFDLNHGS